MIPEAIGIGLGAIGQIGGWLGLGNSQQIKQQQKLTDIQTEANKELASYTSDLQKTMYDYTYNKNTYSAMKNQMIDAGLNPALMYAGGGSSGRKRLQVVQAQEVQAEEVQQMELNGLMQELSQWQWDCN